MVENGMLGLSANPEYGGMGMPGIWSIAAGEMQSAANTAFSMYPGLTNGAAKAIEIGGTEEQKKTFPSKNGIWSVDRYNESDRTPLWYGPWIVKN
jgi:alkylation response protein AidB-like acyl-CoA dehydrogenase